MPLSPLFLFFPFLLLLLTARMEVKCVEEGRNLGSSDNSVTSTEYKTSLMAWIVTLAIMMVNAAASMMWTTGSSAPLTLSDWMSVDLSKVNWLSNVCAINNSVFSILCIWAYEHFGVKRCVAFAAIINCTGCWIRYLAAFAPIEHRYPIVMTGQTIAAIGGPFIYNIAPKLVSVWFAPADRGIGNMLASLSLGMLASPLIIPYLANTTDHIPRMLLAISVIATICSIPILLVPSRPKVAPAASAFAARTSVWEGIKTLLKSGQYWNIAIMTAVNAGMYFTIAVVIIEAAAPYGYSEQQSGIAGALLMFSGFVGGGMIGYWIGKTGQHLMMIKIFTPLNAMVYIMLIWQIIPNGYGALLCSCFSIGFFSMGLFPAQLEYACEISYPIPESVSSNITWAIVTAAMLIFTVITDALRAGPDANPPNNMHMSMIASAIIVSVGSLPCIWLKGEMKRLAIDQA
ncbi:major facilitator superfamily domain-containing protein [Dichotomocladium elegans]|nr:major facilitator superfamily domain-containing protein [Dichotomocladium elegans]